MQAQFDSEIAMWARLEEGSAIIARKWKLPKVVLVEQDSKILDAALKDEIRKGRKAGEDAR